MSEIEVPAEVIEVAAKALFAMNTSPPHEWESIEDSGRDLWRHNARELLLLSLGAYHATVQKRMLWQGREQRHMCRLVTPWREVDR